jgi:hypothetical protein
MTREQQQKQECQHECEQIETNNSWGCQKGALKTP